MIFYWFLEKKEGKEREVVCVYVEFVPLIYAFIGWLMYVPCKIKWSVIKAWAQPEESTATV